MRRVLSQAGWDGRSVMPDAPRCHDVAFQVAEWLRQRRQSGEYEWLYHPRSNDVGHAVRIFFLRDLLAYSRELCSNGLAGKVVCDLNVNLSDADGARRKRLDLVVGRPKSECPHNDTTNPMRKGQVEHPVLVLETKSCMTSHRAAIPRLLDELRSSLEVIRSAAPTALAFAVVLVNVCERFTSPLKRPGPNLHRQPNDAQAVIGEILARVPIGQAKQGYDGLAFGLVDFDNENRIDARDPLLLVEPERTYSVMIARAAELYEEMSLGL
jgi:hypothetical protein